jgi:NAD(P)-dependent dehydrogenase (short-subunit alcohol dehydrogenase family)
MTNQTSLHSNSVVLVSGGGRGITARCAIRLAERAHCKFILLGRSALAERLPDYATDCADPELKQRITADLTARGEKATPQKIQKRFKDIRAQQEVQATLAAVRAAGGQAEYVSVDVSDGAALKAALAEPVQRFGPVTGLIHGAGSLSDKLIEKKTEADFDTVYSPKVTGLENLLSCVSLARLDFLVLFSSIVGVFGNVGQADYAIANEILNKSAYLIQRQAPHCHVVSFDWGPWDAGMVTPELKRAFEARHVELISSEAGAQLLADELLRPAAEGRVQLVVGGVPALPAVHLESELRSYQIRRHLKLEDNPFLYDHRIGEHPVLPATCAAAWVVNTCEELYPGTVFTNIENYRVLKGIVFDDDRANEYTLDLRETSKTPDGRVAFSAVVWSLNPKGRKVFHYSLNVALAREAPELPAAPADWALPNAAQPGLDRQTLYSNGTLFHGPSFQGVDQVMHISPGRLVMRVVLPHVPDEAQGQFPVLSANPFIYDAVVQCLLVWTQYFHNAPCLPSRMKKLVQYRRIPFDTPCFVTMEIISHSDTAVVANLSVQDPAGRLLMRIEELEGTISVHLKEVMGEK